MTIRQGLQEQAESLHAWVMNDAFPFWASVGMHDSGAAWEAIDLSGDPVQSDVSRVRVQARQLVSFALAYKLGWDTDRSRAAVTHLSHVLKRACRRSDGLYGRTMSLSQYALGDDAPDLYDNAFVLLALCHAQSVLGTAAVGDDITSLLYAVDAKLRPNSDDGYFECLPASTVRLQNPHMHLFESLLAAFSNSQDDAIRYRIDQLLEFIERTFFSDSKAIVREIHGSEDPVHNGYFVPGHSFEWVWLLGWRSRLYNESLPDFANALYARALDSLDELGRAPMRTSESGEPLDPTMRLWSQTEALKAHLCIAELGPDVAVTPALEHAKRCCDDILQNWLRPAIRGGWHDHFDAQSNLISKDIPASTGYHLFVAITELLRLVGMGGLRALTP